MTKTFHFTAVLLALAAAPLQGLDSQVFATGLIKPAKMIFGPAGTLVVAEAGTAPNGGRVSIVNSSGTRRTLLEALPSGVANGEDTDGPTGILLDGDTLYVAIGEGDQLVPGATQGTNAVNPKGPASPILATILKIVFSTSVDKISAPFALKVADHTVLADGGTVTLDNGAGATAAVTVLSDFRYRPDAALVYRNTHPYALAQIPNDATNFYLADAGLNSIVQINKQTGRWRTIAKFPPQPSRVIPGPPVADAVPDGIRYFNGRLLVTLLTGFPFGAGASKVMSVDPATGAYEVFQDNLTSAIDIVPRVRFLRPIQYLVLEHTTSLLTGAPGQLKVISPSGTEVIAGGLKAPTSLAYDPATGVVYITSRADGTILKVELGI